MTAAETRELIERIGSPHVRLHLDCKAMATESTPIPELIANNAALLAHFHANDPNRQGPGFGQLGFFADSRSLGQDRLSRLGLGRSIRLRPRHRTACPRQHRLFAGMSYKTGGGEGERL